MKYLYAFLLTIVPFFGLNAQTDTLPANDFHFWLGEWEVYKTGTDTKVGHSSITSLYDGVAMKEVYQANNNTYSGTSLNVYNSLRDRWEQYYIDKDGYVLHISGKWLDGQMCMDDLLDPPNPILRNRICWTPEVDGSVRQVWEQSLDSGQTWKVAFDGTYIRIAK